MEDQRVSVQGEDERENSHATIRVTSKEGGV